jgi:hypothetical protein
MQTHTGATRSAAWLKAAQSLLKTKDRIYNLIVEIEHPDAATVESRAIEARVDEFLTKHDCQPIHTVAETIFPASEYRSGGLAKVYAYADTIFPEINSVTANAKGTYAQRLVRRQRPDGSTFNPLEVALDKMKKQLAKPGPQRAIYELDLLGEELELKFYEADIDKTNVRGGQCLSHVSLKLGPNRELYLTALYRYQFFVQKALGNYKGLARLQAVIARELGIPIGPLVCHATLAVLDNTEVGATWSNADLENLIDDCEKLEGPPHKEKAA